MRLGGRRPDRLLAMLAVVGLAACNPGTNVVLPPLELAVGSGDGQFGVVGALLTTPLRVVARLATTGQPRPGITVLWDVTQGGSSLVGVTTTVTDSTGSAEIRVQLGANPGATEVRARIADQPTTAIAFAVFAVNRPSVKDVDPPSAAAGDTVTLTGTDFSPVPDQNVVLFSGARGRVVTANDTTLRVEVPTCLPARDVRVHLQLGAVPSADSVWLTVTGGAQVTTLQVGEVIDVADDGGFECHALAGGSGVSYLTVVYSASTVGAARHPFRLTALSSVGALPAPARIGAPPSAGAEAQGEPDLQTRWDEYLRGLEADLIKRRGSGTRRLTGPTPAPPAPVPSVGELRSFNVLNTQNAFEQVGAVAQWVGSRAAIFVDTLAPAGGFTPAELGQFADRFDQVIHPEVTSRFGGASDLDANGRIVILFTPAVNRLTPVGSSGFIGGFFYGVDLLPTSTGSNAGEVFYAIVPDPTGIHGNDRTKAQVASVIPAILAHEFQHMVHFNERVLVLGAAGQEALWLSEALAQMAEEVVARAYEGVDSYAADSLFRSGTRVRSRRYLQRPDTVSLIVTTGQGSLPERGAGFLQLLYVEDQVGGDVLERLTQTTRTGIANVEAEVGMDWSDLIVDWWSASYLDQPGSATGPLTYPTVDLRGFLGNPHPLNPLAIGSGGYTGSGSIWSSSAAYYVVSPGVTATTALRLGGEAGGPSTVQAAMRMRIIRVS